MENKFQSIVEKNTKTSKDFYETSKKQTIIIQT